MQPSRALLLTCGGVWFRLLEKSRGRSSTHTQICTHTQLPIQSWCFMYYMFNKIVKKDIPCQHLTPFFLLHFSPERQIQSPECKHKFTQGFGLVDTLTPREMAMRAQRSANWIQESSNGREREKIKAESRKRRGEEPKDR